MFSDYVTHRRHEPTRQLAGNGPSFFATLLSLLSLLGIYITGPIFHFLAPHFPPISPNPAPSLLPPLLLLPFRLRDFEISLQTFDFPDFLTSTASGTSEPFTVYVFMPPQWPLVFRVLSVLPASSVYGFPGFL